jgi:DNA-directed RNA polymerase specialized sigma24 family protein
MSKKNNSIKSQAVESDELTALNRMSRSLEVLVRLNLEGLRGSRSQPEMISTLDSAGCRPAEIAEFLGIAPNTVKVALHRARKKKKNRTK